MRIQHLPTFGFCFPILSLLVSDWIFAIFELSGERKHQVASNEKETYRFLVRSCNSHFDETHQFPAIVNLLYPTQCLSNVKEKLFAFISPMESFNRKIIYSQPGNSLTGTIRHKITHIDSKSKSRHQVSTDSFRSNLSTLIFHIKVIL